MNKHKLFYLLFFCVLWMASCKKGQGCMDKHAVNFDPNADDKCDTVCQYSSIGFYMKNMILNESNDSLFVQDTCTVIDSVRIYMDNIYLGTITQPTYGASPEHCVAPETVNTRLHDGDKHAWYALVFAENCDSVVYSFSITGVVNSVYNKPCQTIKIH